MAKVRSLVDGSLTGSRLDSAPRPDGLEGLTKYLPLTPAKSCIMSFSAVEHQDIWSNRGEPVGKSRFYEAGCTEKAQQIQ